MRLRIFYSEYFFLTLKKSVPVALDFLSRCFFLVGKNVVNKTGPGVAIAGWVARTMPAEYLGLPHFQNASRQSSQNTIIFW